MDESQRALAAAKLANLGAGRPPADGTAEPAAEADETAVSGTGRLVRPNGDGAPIGAVSQKAGGRIDEGIAAFDAGGGGHQERSGLGAGRGTRACHRRRRLPGPGRTRPMSRFAIWVESRVSRAAISVRISPRPAVN